MSPNRLTASRSWLSRNELAEFPSGEEEAAEVMEFRAVVAAASSHTPSSLHFFEQHSLSVLHCACGPTQHLLWRPQTPSQQSLSRLHAPPPTRQQRRFEQRSLPQHCDSEKQKFPVVRQVLDAAADTDVLARHTDPAPVSIHSPPLQQSESLEHLVPSEPQHRLLSQWPPQQSPSRAQRDPTSEQQVWPMQCELPQHADSLKQASPAAEHPPSFLLQECKVELQSLLQQSPSEWQWPPCGRQHFLLRHIVSPGVKARQQVLPSVHTPPNSTQPLTLVG
eukprot:GHVS01098429.1.p2 GENE.GHVS01098429.1~~GHVS01098429.1.p2  ORF type:complete len:278 (-),score=44.32 GHVS01098429.1:173-1006(-)